MEVANKSLESESHHCPQFVGVNREIIGTVVGIAQ